MKRHTYAALDYEGDRPNIPLVAMMELRRRCNKRDQPKIVTHIRGLITSVNDFAALETRFISLNNKPTQEET